MNPRTLKLIACALLIALTHANTTTARTPFASSQKRAKPQTRKQNDTSRARNVERRAVAAIIEAADSARSLPDLNINVEIRADAADALWPFDPGAASAILQSAWKTIADAETLAEHEEMGKADLARRKIIMAAARHDPRLAESFMSDMADEDAPADTEKPSQDQGRQDSTRNDPSSPEVLQRPSETNRRRLSIAFSLLERGEHASAARLAAPAVAEGASRELIEFITALRAVAPAEADALHLRLLERTGGDPSSDANDILMLSTLSGSGGAFYAVVLHDGSTQFFPPARDERTARSTRTDAARHTRNAFFEVAARVLSRDPTPRGGVSQPRAHAAPYYFALKRLIPIFEREAPQHIPLLHARLSALAQELSENQRGALNSNVRLLNARADRSHDPLWFEVDRIERADDEASRDRLRSHAVFKASRKRLWGRAKEMADQIKDSETRRAARSAIAIEQVLSIFEAFEKDDSEDSFERAASFVRAADAPPEARAAGLAQAADLAARRGDARRASELFDEASLLSTNVHATYVKVNLLLLLTDAATRVSAPRAWEKMSSLTSKLNEGDKFNESTCRGGIAVETPGDAPHCIPLPVRLTDLFGIYAMMARLDFGRALDEAHALKEVELRARATLAVARAGLETKGRPARNAR